MKLFVLDASVVLYHYLHETNTVTKRLVNIFELVEKGKAEIVSLSLIYQEVANGVLYSQQELEVQEGVLQSFLSLPLAIEQLEVSDFMQVFELARRQKTTAYDTSYHYLAYKLGGVFLTCDRKYYKTQTLGQIECLLEED